MRQVGATGATIAGAGYVGSETNMMMRRAEAIAPLVVVGAGAAVAGAGLAGGVLLSGSDNPTKKEVQENAAENSTYSAITAYKRGNADDKQELQDRFNSGGSDPWRDSAWSEVRATAAKNAAAGNAQSKALSEARKKVDKQAMRAIINIVETWNNGVKALAPHIAATPNLFTTTPEYSGSNTSGKPYPKARSESYLTRGDQVPPGTTVTTYDPVADSSKSVISEIKVNNPVIDPTKIEGRSEPLKILAINSDVNYSYSGASCEEWVPIIPFDRGNEGKYQSLLNTDFGNDTDSSFCQTPKKARWPVAGETSVNYANNNASNFTDNIDNILGRNAIANVGTKVIEGYSEIISNISTFINEVYGKISAGLIDPADIIGPSTLADAFSQTDSISRVAAELVATGVSAPDDSGYQAEIKHPDLPGSGETLTGWLFLDLPQSSNLTLVSGQTVSPTQYNMAYFAYPSELPDQNISVDVLSSSSGNLEVINLVNTIELGNSVSDGNVTGVETNGNTTVDTGAINGTAPEWIGNYSAVRDRGAVNVSVAYPSMPNANVTVPLSETTLDNGTIDLPTNIEDPTNATVQEIYPLDGVTYEEVVEPVADPTNPANVEETATSLEDYREEIAEEYSGGGGGLIPSSGLPTLPGLGVAGSAAVVVGGLIALRILGD